VIWQQLLSSGKYNLKIQPDRKTAIIYKMSESEISERLSKMPKPAESKFFRTGKTISSFNERDMTGKRFNLKELAGKVVALNFWFINCGPCRREMPEMNEMVESFKDNKDVVFIGIALDEKYNIEEFLKTNPFLYNIIDNGRYIASQYGVTLYPTHVILDRQGKVLFHTSGFATNTVGWVKRSIESALNDTVPASQ
jgi:thiol-disulfide isomerase/thioredoxin